jgi:uncharacterized membrane protein YkvA (DUF1232 family)
MPIRFEFELDDADLAYFRRIIEDKRVGQRGIAVADLDSAVRELLAGARVANTPGFILRMLEQIEPLVAMVSDPEWRLPEADVGRVLSALAFFADPEDLIPDDLPGFGYLDDAVMVELAVRELEPELSAYRNFCEFREQERAARRASGQPEAEVSRQDWLEARRRELMAEMKSRRGLLHRIRS